MLGSGWQAGAQLIAACTVRPIESVRCYSPNREQREKFAREISAELGIAVEPVAQPEDAVAGADIAMCATSSIDNVFFARWIRSGMRLSGIEVRKSSAQRSNAPTAW